MQFEWVNKKIQSSQFIVKPSPDIARGSISDEEQKKQTHLAMFFSGVIKIAPLFG